MESHDPLVWVFPKLSRMDMQRAASMFSIIVVSFVTFLAVFVVSYFLSFFFETFRSHLRPKEKVFWCLAFVRAVFGFMASGLGIWGLAFTDVLHNDVVMGSSKTSFVTVYLCVGFFLFECTAMFGSNLYFRTCDPFLFAHHSLSVLGYSTAAYYGNTHFFAVVGMLLEVTTPFTCLCWMLLKAGMAEHFVWKANQLVLVHLFHCRTTLEGYFYYKTYLQWDNIFYNMPHPLMLLLYTQLSVQFFVLTPYWTYKKTVQLFNPVDWNHPELQSPKAAACLNSHSKAE